MVSIGFVVQFVITITLSLSYVPTCTHNSLVGCCQRCPLASVHAMLPLMLCVAIVDGMWHRSPGVALVQRFQEKNVIWHTSYHELVRG